jgi:hypothetical protein
MAASAQVEAQGVFLFSTPGARTRLYSIDGPLAGTNIYGQMLAGSMLNSLSPIGTPVPHFDTGGICGGRVAVPGVPPYSYAYVQMVAWDSILWGTSFPEVPADQLGRTDIVPVFLTTGVLPDITFAPRFTQPAVVPIPEPSVLALAVLAGLSAWLARFVRGEPQKPR